MSRLDELIAELCPDGVEYKKIKEVYTRIKGTPITASKMKEIEDPDGEIRIFAGGKTVINAREHNIPNANITRVPAVLVQSRGVIDAVYYDKPFTFKNEMWAYTNENQVSVKYLYYVLKFQSSCLGDGFTTSNIIAGYGRFYCPHPASSYPAGDRPHPGSFYRAYSRAAKAVGCRAYSAKKTV